jgi:hypothetical protein
MKDGVIIDAGCNDASDLDGLWLMISDPGLKFQRYWQRPCGPPPDLAVRLRTSSARTKRCRKEAEKLTQELGLARFLHAQ